MNFDIKNRVITGDKDLFLVGDNANYVANFTFDDEWAGVTKTARFISCTGKHKDVLIVDNKCTIPVEVLKCGKISVGVYSSEMTTTEFKVFVHGSIKNKTGNECTPTPNVYEQLTKQLDDIQAGLSNEVAGYFEEHKEDFKGDQGERGEAGAVKFIIVSSLPTENIDDSAIYLKSSADPQTQNAYDEYIYTNGAWECIGTANVKVDLTDYVKNTDYATATTAGLIKANSSQGFFIGTNGDMSIVQATENDINNRTNKFRPITANNLDKSVKASLTTNTETLTEEEKTAAQSWLGVPKIELTLKENGAYTLTINKG